MQVRFRFLFPMLLLPLALLVLSSSRVLFNGNEDGARTKLDEKRVPIRNKLKGVARKDASIKWFTEQRNYPYGFIPEDAEIRAVEDVRTRMIPQLQSKGFSLAKSSAAQLQWEFSGPGNIGGRLRSLLIHPQNPNLLYVGSVSGGVWKSTDAGATWTPTMNDLITLNISAMAMKPDDPNTIYAGTGEGFLSDGLPGRGLLKTTDGGQTWTRSSVANGLNTPFITALAVTPANPNVIFAAGREAVPQYLAKPAETTPDPGVSAIFKSTDAGQTWQDVTTGKGIDLVPNFPFDNMATDVVVSPADANVVYGSFGTHFESGGIWKSTNGGQAWTRLTNGLPNPAAANQGYARIKLAMAPSDPNILYASFTYLKRQNDTSTLRNGAMLGIWKTTDAGQTWTQLTTPQTVGQINMQDGYTTPLGQQGNYDNALIIHPTDPNIVFVAGLDIYKTTNGGNTWSQISYWIKRNAENLPYVHADHHVFAFDRSTNPPTLYNGSDGGIVRTRDLGANWENLNRDLGVTQFYYLAVHPTNPSIMLGGTQDNGTPASFDGNRNNWFDVTGGDGGPSHFDYNDPTTFYASVYHAAMTRYYEIDFASGTGKTKEIGFTDGSNGITQADVSGSAFFAPFEISPNNPNTLVLGTNRLLKTTNRGDSWTPLSNAVGVPIVAVAIAEGNDNIIWLATQAGQNKAQIYKTEDGGGNYVNVTSANMPDRYVSDIEFDPSNTRTVYVSYNGYGTPHVFKSTDAGANWTNVSNNLPDVPVNTVQVHPQQPNVIFIGTDIGVFVSEDGGQVWQPANNGLPTVPVVALILNTNLNKIFAGTHGRGAYSASLTGGGAAVLEVDAQSVAIQTRPGNIGTSTFNLSNSGAASLSFNIAASGGSNQDLLPPRPIDARLNNQLAGLDQTPALRAPAARISQAVAAVASSARAAHASVLAGVQAAPHAEDVLILDDGNSTPDDFIGFNGSNDLYWMNSFQPFGFSFKLDAVDFYMRTEGAAHNPVYIAVLDGNLNKLVESTVALSLSPNGQWYRITLNNPITFNDGQAFYVQIGATLAINFPAGADKNAQVPSSSYYFDPQINQFLSLSTVSGFEAGAFLIRAVGVKTGPANQPPIPMGTISKTTANINETITFNGSLSFDPDGQITKYEWNFGDGSSSAQAVATHAYAKAGTYTVTLTVTDNQGATGQAVGQVTINGPTNQPPVARAQISPNPALVNQTITFDASTSSDPDGQIAQYAWNFGDGTNSNQQIATKSYTQAGTYNVSLTVTDNNGATGQITAQVKVDAPPSRLTVSPTSGAVPVNGVQLITVRFDAQGLAEGNYQGQLSITSNGGNRVIPVSIVVSNNVSVEDNAPTLPIAFRLEQNFPNPFNPETTIPYALARESQVTLQIFDVNGRQVAQLVEDRQAPGEYRVRWDGRTASGNRAPSGVYLYRLEVAASNGEKAILTKKLTLMK